MSLNKDSTILIVGAGTFGLSTALNLARKGYSNITCFDRDTVPSNFSAGNDSNKMVDTLDSIIDSVNYKVRQEAKKLWKTDPIFKPYYHPVGFYYAACSQELLDSLKDIQELKKLNPHLELLDSPEKIKKHLPQISGSLPNWCAYFISEDDGWLHARDSLKSAYRECCNLGVKFVFGDDGEISDFKTKDTEIISLKSKSGKEYFGERYVLCAGANAPKIFNFEGQLQSKCWTLAHIKLTKEEAEKYKNCPVIFNVEKGFFFEADENDEIKICNEFPGYTNLNKDGESIPFYADQIPLEAAQAVRQYLKDVLPELAEKKFTKTKICWCADSPNRDLILTEHPDYSNLVIGSGDSGKSFMLMPVIGKYISKIVTDGNNSLTELERDTWRWRPESSKEFDESQGRHGGSGIVTDIKNIQEWVSVDNPDPHPLNV